MRKYRREPAIYKFLKKILWTIWGIIVTLIIIIILYTYNSTVQEVITNLVRG